MTAGVLIAVLVATLAVISRAPVGVRQGTAPSVVTGRACHELPHDEMVACLAAERASQQSAGTRER